MAIEVSRTQDVCHLAIKDEMTIYTAAEMKNELLEHLNLSQELEISLHDVTELDSAGVQLILLLRHEARRLNKELRFVNHSLAVVDVLELFNLVPYLGDPVVLPAGGARNG